MGNIERWKLIVGRDGDIHGFAFPNGNRHLVTNPHMDSREVEVVPAEQLRGAVDLLHRARGYLLDLGEDGNEGAALVACAIDAEYPRPSGGQ